MAKNTIGQFIAALRKANGMTQQDVADRLNVSNKAVSRWERDECAPDLSVIPALAEMFGVTCDELLKGERIIDATPSERMEPRVEKQFKNLLSRTLSNFKTMIWASIASSAIGLICMFGISYGFYRPVIGFAVMCLFEVCSLVIAGIGLSNAKDEVNDNELFESADPAVLSGYKNTLGSMSFTAFFCVLAVVVLSLPLIIWKSDYVDSVLSAQSYFTIFFGVAILILALIFFACRGPYIRLVTGEKDTSTVTPAIRSRRAMTFLQVSLTILAGIGYIIAPDFNRYPDDISAACIVFTMLSTLCILGNITCFPVFLFRLKSGRNELILPGIRNILLIPAVRIISSMHIVCWTSDNGLDNWSRYDSWSYKYLTYSIIYVLVVMLVFTVIEILIKHSRNK